MGKKCKCCKNNTTYDDDSIDVFASWGIRNEAPAGRENGLTEPVKSVYCSPVVSTKLGSKQFYFHSTIFSESALLQKAISETQLRGVSQISIPSLSEVDPDVFESVLQYVYSGDYKTCNGTEDTEFTASEALIRHCGVYVFAVKYQMAQLVLLTDRNIQNTYRGDLKTFLPAVRSTYKELPIEDNWFREYFKEQLKLAIEQDPSIVREEWLSDIFRDANANLSIDVFETFARSCDIRTGEPIEANSQQPEDISLPDKDVSSVEESSLDELCPTDESSDLRPAEVEPVVEMPEDITFTETAPLPEKTTSQNDETTPEIVADTGEDDIWGSWGFSPKKSKKKSKKVAFGEDELKPVDDVEIHPKVDASAPTNNDWDAWAPISKKKKKAKKTRVFEDDEPVPFASSFPTFEHAEYQVVSREEPATIPDEDINTCLYREEHLRDESSWTGCKTCLGELRKIARKEVEKVEARA